ncbi:MAG: PBSX family phage terminase large subunit [Oscillospiraceae bacterium]|nr:PBSX family phage terminase large subunit [Oscillospiraceae bacterium]
MDKLKFTEKQNELIRVFKQDKLKRLNVLEGSVRSGKTWISLILWAIWVATRPKDYLYMMCAKSLQTLKRNCLLPMQELVGEKYFKFSLSTKEGVLFGRKIMLEGANDMRSESKIRGITLGGAYCDELTLFPKDFFVMLLSRLSAPGAKLIATTNPDVPTHWLLTEYLKNEKLTDDLFRMFFHIDDNTTLPDDYVASLKKEYTGVYYDRFILGKWVVANGAIYKVFSDSPRSYDIKSSDLPSSFEYLNVGLDFGGNGSQHALCATGISHDMRKIYALKSERISAADMTPQALYKRVCDFCEDIQKRYGKVSAVYADSAEQTLIAGLRQALRPLGIIVKNSMKREINDRIRTTTMLMAGGRFYLVSGECQTLIDAFQGAVWDDKVIGKEVRLDDGTSDIDTLDAFEYSFERHIPQLIRSEK